MNSLQTVLFKKLSEKAILPKRSTQFSAGYDLYSAAKKIIPSQGKELVPLNIAIALPEGTYGRIAPRSGLASKKHIDVGAGTIDADYRGEVFVLLFNHSKEDFEVNEGDRVAQLIVSPYVQVEFKEVEELSETERGVGGFGSTGTN